MNGAPLRESLRLNRIAWATVRRDRTMCLLTFASTGLSVALLLAGLRLGGWFDGRDERFWDRFAAIFPFMVVVGSFFGVALSAAAFTALDGSRLSTRSALWLAVRRLPRLVGWHALALGRGVRSLVTRRSATRDAGGRRTALSVVTIIAVEDLGPWACLKRATELTRRWHGRPARRLAIVAWTPLGSGAFTFMLLSSSSLGRTWGPVSFAVTMPLFLTLFGLAGATATLFRVALYRYLADGSVSGGFAESDLADPFQPPSRTAPPVAHG